jgi:hypothetical protein
MTQRHRANCLAKVSTQVCAGGVADISRWWSPSVTTGTREGYSQPRRGDRLVLSLSPLRGWKLSLSPLRGWKGGFDRIRRFLRRLISGVPQGQRGIPDLCRSPSSTTLGYYQCEVLLFDCKRKGSLPVTGIVEKRP